MADSVFIVKGIKPKKLNIKAIRDTVLNEAKKEAKDQQQELNKTIQTWQGDKPKFISDVDVSSNDVAVLTGPGGNAQGIKKWNWLNAGTSVRYAVMSKNWRSKTTPGSLKSGAGRGKMLFVSRRRPRPGIKARGWAEMVQKRRRKPFTDRMIKAMRDAGSKAF